MLWSRRRGMDRVAGFGRRMRRTRRKRGRRGALAGVTCAAVFLAAACGKVFPLFPEKAPTLRAGEGLREAKFRIVAKDYVCDPSVIAIDRDGRAIRVILTVTSVEKEHIFSIPDLEIRRSVPAGGEATIQFVADRSGIFEFGCSRFPALWMNPLEKRGKLAVK